ncbi:DUF6612 family protein [Numidum massiliense]|uniref:DUF6612 family protein n=1 Tax=Numidum massiliense TaxID=1522315 RepID=UPI0011C849A8|nr:DUF6612 family protein [Numidum massiliense]
MRKTVTRWKMFVTLIVVAGLLLSGCNFFGQGKGAAGDKAASAKGEEEKKEKKKGGSKEKGGKKHPQTVDELMKLVNEKSESGLKSYRVNIVSDMRGDSHIDYQTEWKYDVLKEPFAFHSQRLHGDDLSQEAYFSGGELYEGTGFYRGDLPEDERWRYDDYREREWFDASKFYPATNYKKILDYITSDFEALHLLEEKVKVEKGVYRVRATVKDDGEMARRFERFSIGVLGEQYNTRRDSIELLSLDNISATLVVDRKTFRPLVYELHYKAKVSMFKEEREIQVKSNLALSDYNEPITIKVPDEVKKKAETYERDMKKKMEELERESEQKEKDSKQKRGKESGKRDSKSGVAAKLSDKNHLLTLLSTGNEEKSKYKPSKQSWKKLQQKVRQAEAGIASYKNDFQLLSIVGSLDSKVKGEDEIFIEEKAAFVRKPYSFTRDLSSTVNDDSLEMHDYYKDGALWTDGFEMHELGEYVTFPIKATDLNVLDGFDDNQLFLEKQLGMLDHLPEPEDVEESDSFYKLTFALTTRDAIELKKWQISYDTLDELTQNLWDKDFKAFEFKVYELVTYIDRKNHRLTRIVVAKDGTENSGFGLENVQSISASQFHSFNKVKEITVPDDVKRHAKEEEVDIEELKREQEYETRSF